MLVGRCGLIDRAAKFEVESSENVVVVLLLFPGCLPQQFLSSGRCVALTSTSAVEVDELTGGREGGVVNCGLCGGGGGGGRREPTRVGGDERF